MGKLSGRRVLVGITGGIAAYKSVDLTRRLREYGAEVQVVLTPAAKEFITPLTLQATSGNPVHESLLHSDAEAGMGHIELARWPDQVIIAPASADFIARLAAGLADTLLSTICLATEAPVAIAPAMNRAMWDKAVTRRNVATLESWGAQILGPDSGEQACGETGPGRMLEPGEIVSILARSKPVGVLQDLQVLVTAGPTWEALDPVRALTNHSSGKMG
ncbi:MAG: bifunctional phosphopantothenoylcysteine decarboxylase/phosphopantothenate--cysteine ligase CoaBC, partial [Pseudomonadota bacterium]|nr:bifunctional phosphopantothenoylcysteine decarboxylase/phosphopantothenate--cysteine ligase CoaBC [Pseudomonadota bacterium]